MKKFFKKRKKKKLFLLKKEDHISADWAIALIVFFVSVILILVVDALIFIRIDAKESVFTAPNTETDIVDEELLNATLEFYNEREKQFIKYRNEKPVAPNL